jgi:hypothetical protein
MAIVATQSAVGTGFSIQPGRTYSLDTHIENDLLRAGYARPAEGETMSLKQPAQGTALQRHRRGPKEK